MGNHGQRGSERRFTFRRTNIFRQIAYENSAPITFRIIPQAILPANCPAVFANSPHLKLPRRAMGNGRRSSLCKRQGKGLRSKQPERAQKWVETEQVEYDNCVKCYRTRPVLLPRRRREMGGSAFLPVFARRRLPHFFRSGMRAYTLAMPSAIARAEVDRQIEDVVVELEAASAQGRVNIFLIRMAGGVAALVGRHDLTTRLGAIISGMTVEDLLCGSITNIDPKTVDTNRPLKLPSLDAAGRQHPECDDDSIIERMKTQVDVHVQLCLNGDVDSAKQAASSPLALEDIGCTLAVMGQFDRANDFIDAQKVDAGMKSQVRFVILLEKCRRELPGFIEAVRQARHKGYEQLHVILALTGRLPWTGYPLSDW
ncbi:MAG: hypothetical protein JWP03_567 [Phycisphaerales bacterium]|nr:hypothetical protein [Phycisphaerales bacterium]